MAFARAGMHWSKPCGWSGCTRHLKPTGNSHRLRQKEARVLGCLKHCWNPVNSVVRSIFPLHFPPFWPIPNPRSLRSTNMEAIAQQTASTQDLRKIERPASTRHVSKAMSSTTQMDSWLTLVYIPIISGWWLTYPSEKNVSSSMGRIIYHLGYLIIFHEPE